MEGGVYIAGHRGMVGSALSRAFAKFEGVELITATSKELDLRRQADTVEFIERKKPRMVIVAAAKVGGIHANSTYPAEFIYDNLMIASNLVEASYRNGVERLLFLGSSCIYPRDAEQPIQEGALLTAPLESTNEAYALAKIAGLKMCEHYRKQYGCLFHSAMPCNLYGVGDNYHPENSHVIPALIRRYHEAKEAGAESVTIWGSGKPRREFLYADDLAKACLHLVGLEDPPSLVNIGSGGDITIQELANEVSSVVGFTGETLNDPTKPDGTQRKLMDSSLINQLGWSVETPLREGLEIAYRDFLSRNQS